MTDTPESNPKMRLERYNVQNGEDFQFPDGYSLVQVLGWKYDEFEGWHFDVWLCEDDEEEEEEEPAEDPAPDTAPTADTAARATVEATPVEGRAFQVVLLNRAQMRRLLDTGDDEPAREIAPVVTPTDLSVMGFQEG